MKATKIIIETDENIALVLEGRQAEIAFNQMRYFVYNPNVPSEFKEKVFGDRLNVYMSPYAQYTVRPLNGQS